MRTTSTYRSLSAYSRRRSLDHSSCWLGNGGVAPSGIAGCASYEKDNSLIAARGVGSYRCRTTKSGARVYPRISAGRCHDPADAWRHLYRTPSQVFSPFPDMIALAFAAFGLDRCSPERMSRASVTRNGGAI